jgi:cytoskeleton-associated protein 5
MSGLIAKCLGAPKAKTKDMAVQIALMYVEIEKYEIVQEELMKGITTQKNPKVVAACIGTLSQALRYASFHLIFLSIISISNTLFEGYIESIANNFVLCREFGPKVINLKPVLKHVPVLLEDRDKNVRDEGKKLVVELYRWIGQALKPQLSALKPIQVRSSHLAWEADYKNRVN